MGSCLVIDGGLTAKITCGTSKCSRSECYKTSRTQELLPSHPRTIGPMRMASLVGLLSFAVPRCFWLAQTFRSPVFPGSKEFPTFALARQGRLYDSRSNLLFATRPSRFRCDARLACRKACTAYILSYVSLSTKLRAGDRRIYADRRI